MGLTDNYQTIDKNNLPFIDIVTKLQNENNLSIKKLMRSLNISEANYYRWKNNFNKPAMYSLISIAKFFDVSIDYLVGHCK